MSERFDDVARSLAGERSLSRRSVVRGVLAALGVGAGALATRQPAGAAQQPPAGKGPSGTSCPPGLTACGTVCRDLSSNSTHCGACNTVCPNDSVCRNGVCVQVSCSCDPTCPTGTTWCGSCVNTATDPAHCGGCGAACPAGQVCTNGACGPPPECSSASQCPGTDTICRSRTCTNGVCGFANAPTTTICSPGVSCDGNGQCPQQCPPGFTICNGVCVNTSNDPANCGNCGSQCPPRPNSTTTCSNGNCIYTCSPGYADCDGNPSTGCEVFIAGSVSNCGACANVCPAGPNSFPVCSNGNCGLVCATGFANCDGNPNTGCETNLTSSNTNCGACGNACPSGTTCTNGTCVCVPVTCEELGRGCGTVNNGCGGQIDCGPCGSGEICLGGICQPH